MRHDLFTFSSVMEIILLIVIVLVALTTIKMTNKVNIVIVANLIVQLDVPDREHSENDPCYV